MQLYSDGETYCTVLNGSMKLATGRPTGQINSWVGVHKLPIFVEDFPKEIFQKNRKIIFPKILEKFLWNILYKNRQLVYPYL